MIDFRRYFVLQHAQLAKQVNMGDAVRRSKLIAPYREHLQSRAMHYLSRVPLDPPPQCCLKLSLGNLLRQLPFQLQYQRERRHIDPVRGMLVSDHVLTPPVWPVFPA